MIEKWSNINFLDSLSNCDNEAFIIEMKKIDRLLKDFCIDLFLRFDIPNDKLVFVADAC